ncbi:UBX domain-containing protein 4-like [Gigantopelta aegis]|uniref:UBX domain-containing protein 4-like n=1 Tax=Gigantopelta aegis TaxID=1735272 RepID=UPI001B88B044|nr:UBX domain-containing protein 4-like [Gigantopelta aegis]
MKWFLGSIEEAIKLSKDKELLFIVYISGKDDLSKQMLSTWGNEEVCTLCESEQCIAINIEAESDACGFFSQIYPVVIVPSTFFISTNGIPIEVTGGYVDSKEFIKILKTVLQTHKSKAPSTFPISSATDTSAPPSSGADFPPQESDSPTNSTTDSKANDSGGDMHQQDFEARVAIAQEKIEQKREERSLKEKEVCRVFISYVGRDAFIDRPTPYFAPQYLVLKGKRERVKENIARDRAERAAKYNTEKENKLKSQEEAKKAKLSVQQKKAELAESKRSETARLQFRLTDGTSITQEFSSTDTLQTAYTFISQHLNGSVTLSTIFPKRVFTEDEMTSTLASLNLAPSAVIIVMPKKRAVTQYSGGGGSGDLLSMVLAPLMMLWNFIISLFTSSPSSSATSSTSSSPATQAAGGDGVRSGAYRRPSPGGISRREGNLHRFTNKLDNDDDEDSATWNGNSTQQL